MTDQPSLGSSPSESETSLPAQTEIDNKMHIHMTNYQDNQLKVEASKAYSRYSSFF